jgi:lipopolysaccharide export system permease protein
MIALADRYIARTILLSTSLVTAVLLVLFAFVVVVDALPDVGRGNFGMYELIRYVVLSQPRKIYELAPVICLIGTIMGLSTLALGSELIALRAAGYSIARIIWASIKIAMIFVLAVVLWGELVVPVSENLAQTGRAMALNQGLQKKGSGLWLRDGSTIVNVSEILPDLTLLRVNMYDLDENLRLRGQTFAQRARYEQAGWRLEEARESRIDTQRIEIGSASSRLWQTRLTPEVVSAFAVKPEALSMVQLSRYIGHLERNHQDHGRYSLTLWQKLLMPAAILIMVVLASPFVFRPIRSGGLAQRIFIGIMLGLAFVIVGRSFGFFALIYGLPPVAGAVLPVATFLAIAVLMVRRIR